MEDCRLAAMVIAGNGVVQPPSTAATSQATVSQPPPPFQMPHESAGDGSGAAGGQASGAAVVETSGPEGRGVGVATRTDGTAPITQAGGAAGTPPPNLGGHRVRHARALTVESVKAVSPRTPHEVRAWGAAAAAAAREGGSEEARRDRAVNVYNTEYFALTFSRDPSVWAGRRGPTSRDIILKGRGNRRRTVSLPWWLRDHKPNPTLPPFQAASPPAANPSSPAPKRPALGPTRRRIEPGLLTGHL